MRTLGWILGAVIMCVGCGSDDGSGVDFPGEAGEPKPTDDGGPVVSPPGDVDATPSHDADAPIDAEPPPPSDAGHGGGGHDGGHGGFDAGHPGFDAGGGFDAGHPGFDAGGGGHDAGGGGHDAGGGGHDAGGGGHDAGEPPDAGVPAKTWTYLFDTYLAAGTPGRCGDGGCHSSTKAGVRCDTKNDCYSTLQSAGYINGTGSRLTRQGSCLTWFGGNMPPSGGSDAQAVSDFKSWSANGAPND